MNRQDFEKYCRSYKEYKEANQGQKIPSDYVTEDGIGLGAWYNSLNHRIKIGSLLDDEVEIMHVFNVECYLRPLRWDEWFELIRDCINNEIDILGATQKNGYQIGTWLKRQKREKSKLSGIQFKKLAEVGVFEESKRYYPPKRKKTSGSTTRKEKSCNDFTETDLETEYKSTVCTENIKKVEYSNFNKAGMRTLEIEFENSKFQTYQKVSKGVGIFVDVINISDLSIEFEIREFYLVQENNIVTFDFDESGYSNTTNINAGMYKTVARIWKEDSLIEHSVVEGNYIVFIIDDLTFKKSYICKFEFQNNEWKRVFVRLKG